MIVEVVFRKSGDEYSGRPYNYNTDLGVKVGDIVICPTASGLNYARVERVDVPPEEVNPRWRNSLREIVDFAEGG